MIKLFCVLSFLVFISGCNSMNISNKNANININKYGVNANIYTNIEF